MAAGAIGSPTDGQLRAAYLRERHVDIASKQEALKLERTQVADDTGVGWQVGGGILGLFGGGAAGIAGAHLATKPVDKVDDAYDFVGNGFKLAQHAGNGLRAIAFVGAAAVGGAWGGAKIAQGIVGASNGDAIAAKQGALDAKIGKLQVERQRIEVELHDLGEPLPTRPPATTTG